MISFGVWLVQWVSSTGFPSSILFYSYGGGFFVSCFWKSSPPGVYGGDLLKFPHFLSSTDCWFRVLTKYASLGCATMIYFDLLGALFSQSRRLTVKVGCLWKLMILGGGRLWRVPTSHGFPVTGVFYFFISCFEQFECRRISWFTGVSCSEGGLLFYSYFF